MGFRFLHTADWQLGKPFARFDAETRGQLQAQRLHVIDRLAAAAREGEAAHVLVAGDVFDQEQPSNAVLYKALDKMTGAGVTWWLLPGNHDPAGAMSLWERLAGLGLPDNVRLLVTPEPQNLAEGVTLLPAPWTSKQPGRDLTDIFGAGDGVRIGLAHGSVQGFGTDPDTSALIPEDRAERSQLAYLALGDWHGMRPAGPRAFYAGTPEPDDFRTTKQGTALLVDLDRPDEPKVVETGHFRWKLEKLTLSPGDDPEARLRALYPPGGAIDDVLVDLRLDGGIPLSDRRRLDAALGEAAARLMHLRVSDADLKTLAEPEALDDLLGAGPLRDVAGRLRERSLAGDDEAEMALLLLAGFAAPA